MDPKKGQTKPAPGITSGPKPMKPAVKPEQPKSQAPKRK
jgi:hypothetical protein